MQLLYLKFVIIRVVIGNKIKVKVHEIQFA